MNLNADSLPARLPTLAEVRSSRVSLRQDLPDTQPEPVPTVRYTYEEAV